MNPGSIFQQPFLSLLLIAASMGIMVFALTRWKLRAMRPTAGTGALLMGCGALWMLTNAAEMASPDLNTALLWYTIGHVGIAPIPVLWFVMALQFTGYRHLLTRRRLMLLSLIPAISLIALLTNSAHNLFLSSTHFKIWNSVGHLLPEPGPFMVLHYLYAYGIVLWGTFFITQKVLRSPAFRWQGVIVLLGVMLVAVANVLDWSQLNPVPQIMLTPFALMIAVVLFIVTLIRVRRADIIPIARTNVIQIMQDAVLVLDVENRIIDLNPAAETLVGQRLPSILGTTIDSSWPEWARQTDILSGMSTGRNEIRLGLGNQQSIFDVRRSELTDWRGQPVSRVVVLRDITERARAEEILRLSEEHFRALTENATDLVMIVDSDALVNYASPSMERGLGFKPAEIIGKSAVDFVHPDDLSCVRMTLARVVQSSGVATPIIIRFRQVDGSWHKLECIANNLLDHPAVKGIIINARDVTEREAIAESLRQSEERYRLHFAHMNDVIYSYDSQLQITSVSPSVERILGYKPEALLGKSLLTLEGLEFLSPAYYAKAASEALRVLSGERIEGAIYEFIAQDGRPIIAEISGSPIYQDGQIIATVNVARDITERMRVEERLRSSLQEKEVLLKEIHHRVKNNLQIIASLLNLQSSTIDNPLLITQFQDSQNRIRSMALIHERLYRSGDLAHVDFRAYLRDLSGHLLQSYNVQTSGMALKVEVDDIQLDIDTAIPCSLLVNELVSNTLKHAFPDGRSGTIGVEMRCGCDGQYWLTVWDDGVGMPAEMDWRSTTSLGLQLVNSLTRQLGGTVDVQSLVGTRFTVCFPKAISPPAVRAENPP